jgi:hypothetical protein
MDIYTLGNVVTTHDGRGDVHYGFNIVGFQGRPLVTFSFETREEADAARIAIQPVIAKVKVLTPHPPPYPR